MHLLVRFAGLRRSCGLQHGDPSRSFAVALQKAGYRTAMMGKYLNGYQPADHPAPGWDEWDVTGNGYPEFNYTLNENGHLQHYGHAPAGYLTDVLSGKASSFISSSASSGKPFMLEVATFAPHAPYTPAPRYAHAAAAVAYPKTSAYDRLPANPPSWLRGRPPLAPAEQHKILKAYRKRVEADLSVDDMIGRLESELRAKGLMKNTYFVFSSDNGYHMGEYRLHPGKQTAFDTDIHVPLIVSGPGVPAGRVASQLTSNIDLCPTFETLAGVPVPPAVDGHTTAPTTPRVTRTGRARPVRTRPPMRRSARRPRCTSGIATASRSTTTPPTTLMSWTTSPAPASRAGLIARAGAGCSRPRR